jgi:vacuolar-type H+-ATPase subunit E/Vma4
VSIDALLSLVGRHADAEANALLAAAEARARAIIAAAEAQVATRRERELARLAGERRHAMACATAAAQRGHREAWLRERDRVLDRVFAEAGQALAVAPLHRYERSLGSVVDDTLRYLERIPSVLRCRPEAAPLVERLVAGRAEVTVEPDTEAGAGILGEAADGTVVVDSTLVAWLARRRPELAAALAARLETAAP